MDRLRQATPGLEIVYRDLTATPLALCRARTLPPRKVAAPEAALQPDIAAGQAVLEEFLAADIVVLGAPMYNFTIPSQLKAWIDRIVVAGKTFKYGAQGAEGLAGNKRVIIAISRGGFYGAGTPAAVGEHLETYLRWVFAFIGVQNPEFISADGIQLGPEHREKAVAGAPAGRDRTARRLILRERRPAAVASPAAGWRLHEHSLSAKTRRRCTPMRTTIRETNRPTAENSTTRNKCAGVGIFGAKRGNRHETRSDFGTAVSPSCLIKNPVLGESRAFTLRFNERFWLSDSAHWRGTGRHNRDRKAHGAAGRRMGGGFVLCLSVGTYRDRSARRLGEAVAPPSTNNSWPWIWAASSDARNNTVFET